MQQIESDVSATTCRRMTTTIRLSGTRKKFITVARAESNTHEQCVGITRPLIHITEGLRERTEHLDISLFFHPLLNGVLFPMFCLLVEGECRILVF